jgi:hypothetical protein
VRKHLVSSGLVITEHSQYEVKDFEKWVEKPIPQGCRENLPAKLRAKKLFLYVSLQKPCDGLSTNLRQDNHHCERVVK